MRGSGRNARAAAGAQIVLLVIDPGAAELVHWLAAGPNCGRERQSSGKRMRVGPMSLSGVYGKRNNALQVQAQAQAERTQRLRRAAWARRVGSATPAACGREDAHCDHGR